MPAIGWYNGTVGPLDEMKVPMLDRAVCFGDGCYEACLANGVRAFAIEKHLDRFYRSLSLLRIPFSVDREALGATLSECLAAAGEDCAVLYWQVSRATAPRTHAFPVNGAKPNLMITVTPKTLLPDERTVRLITAEDIRYSMCHVKTLNLIPNVLASERAKENGADEAVFVRGGFVTEGAHTNVHILKDGTDFATNFTAELACLNNIGPGLGMVGPMGNYSFYHPALKMLLTFNMLTGRLELFPMIVLFSPMAWRKNG